MRNVVVVCQSTGAARVRVARVLDQYLWRIGDGTWRGRASGACLKRMAKELRHRASRNTAVAVHEAKNGTAYKDPIFTIGRKDAFGPRGVVAVSTAQRAVNPSMPAGMKRAWAVLQVAAFFHDMGKASSSFQGMLAAAQKDPSSKVGSSVRHELLSFALWDILVQDADDAGVIRVLQSLDGARIDAAWDTLKTSRARYTQDGNMPIKAGCLTHDGLGRAVGLLILTHHRLPESTGFENITSGLHMRKTPSIAELTPAAGVAFWHDEHMLKTLHKACEDLSPGPVGMSDVLLRVCLQAGDHMASQAKQPSLIPNGHMANTCDVEGGGKRGWGDTLLQHTQRVLEHTDLAFHALIGPNCSFPSVGFSDTPQSLKNPPVEGVYGWQGRAVQEVQQMVLDGGFFGCIVAGTGTGKTFGLPAILAAATFADANPHRRLLRFTLGLGLRTLASQSARSYVEDVGFSAGLVREMIGGHPISFEAPDVDFNPSTLEGSESLNAFGDEDAVEISGVEETRLSWSPDDEMAEPMVRLFSGGGERFHKKNHAALRLLKAPIVAATVDQVMASVRPTKSSHLAASMRVMTSDLIVDEVDQLGPEDIVCVCALIRQAGAAGRRVLIASATLPPDVARMAFLSYRAGWREYADMSGFPDKVGVVVSGDVPGALGSMDVCEDIVGLYEGVVRAQCAAENTPRIRAQVLDAGADWKGIVKTVSDACNEAHVGHSQEGVSAGLVRHGRIASCVGMAQELAALPGPEGVERCVVVLHSRMTRAARSFIEHWLKHALNRKTHPFHNLVGSLRAAQKVGAVQLLVVSSPVVETGNDLDFDYCVTDPTDARSVVQVAGRVYRHRRTSCVTTPNLFILGVPLQVAAGAVFLENPGPETNPASQKTLVSRPTFPEGVSNKSAVSFLGDLVKDASARHLLIPNPVVCPAVGLDMKVRLEMFEGKAALNPSKSSSLDRCGVGRLNHRRFRRPDGRPTSTIMRKDKGWFLLARGLPPAKVLVQKSASSHSGAFLFQNPENLAFDRWAIASILPPVDATEVRVPVSAEILAGGRSVLTDDPVFGLMVDSQDPCAPFGKR